jgi:hypothetical protein
VQSKRLLNRAISRLLIGAWFFMAWGIAIGDEARDALKSEDER